MNSPSTSADGSLDRLGQGGAHPALASITLTATMLHDTFHRAAGSASRALQRPISSIVQLAAGRQHQHQHPHKSKPLNDFSARSGTSKSLNGLTTHSARHTGLQTVQAEDFSTTVLPNPAAQTTPPLRSMLGKLDRVHGSMWPKARSAIILCFNPHDHICYLHVSIVTETFLPSVTFFLQMHLAWAAIVANQSLPKIVSGCLRSCFSATSRS